MEGYSIVIQKHPSKHPNFNYKYLIGSRLDGLRSDMQRTSMKLYDRKIEISEEMTRRIVLLKTDVE